MRDILLQLHLLYSACRLRLAHQDFYCPCVSVALGARVEAVLHWLRCELQVHAARVSAANSGPLAGC
jgi:hypothetical protein